MKIVLMIVLRKIFGAINVMIITMGILDVIEKKAVILSHQTTNLIVMNVKRVIMNILMVNVFNVDMVTRLELNAI